MIIITKEMQALIDRNIKLEKDMAVLQEAMRREIEVLVAQKQAEIDVLNVNNVANVNIKVEQHKTDIVQYINDANILTQKHSIELANLNVKIANAEADKNHAVSMAEDALRETFKTELVNLSEAKAVAEQKASDIGYQNADLKTRNTALETQIAKMYDTMTEMAKDTSRVHIVEPKIIQTEAKVNILQAPVPQNQVTKF